MTFVFLKVNGDTFILRKITYVSTTESFDVITEAVETGIQTIFKRLKGSEHFFCGRSLQKPSTSRNKRREANYLNAYKDQLTTFFLENNNDFYLLERLTYDTESKVFTILTERVGDWKKS